MLNSLRGATGSWIAKIFLGLLVLSFAVWGIGDIFISRNADSIATVGDREIDVNRFAQALRNQTAALEQQIGRPLSMQEAQALGAPQSAIADLARQEAMFAEADDLSVSASDINIQLSIAMNPAFHNALGEFDPAQYRQTLDFSGVSPAEYEDGQRRALASNLVSQFAGLGYQLPSGMAERLHLFNNESRRFHYVTLDRQAAGEIEAPDDAALQAHLEANAEDFSSPEFRTARFIVVSPDELAKQQSATDAEAREIYEIRKVFYNTPETRAIRRIVYQSDEEVEAAKAKLDGGATFFDLAAERDLTPADTFLDEGSAGSFETGVAEAAFALSEPGVAGPVQTDFGPALIQVDSITPGSVRSFEDVQQELEDTVRRDKALDEILRIETEIADFVEGGADLDLIARNLGFEVSATQALDSNGASPDGAVTGASADPAFLTALFAAEKEFVAGPLSLSDDSVVLLSLTDVTPPALRPLEEVRGAVIESLEEAEVAAQLAQLAEEIVDRVNEGVLFAQEVDPFGKVLTASSELTRGQATVDIPSDLVRALFEQKEGGASWAPLGDGTRVVIGQVFEVNTPEGEESDAEKASLAGQINMIAQADIQEMLTRAAVADRGVLVNNSAIEQTLADLGGYAR